MMKLLSRRWHFSHYNDIIMTMIASQITSLRVVYSIVYSGTDQRKQWRGKCFHLMTSSCLSMKGNPYTRKDGLNIEMGPRSHGGLAYFCQAQDFFELLERMQGSRIDDQRCDMPSSLIQVRGQRDSFVFVLFILGFFSQRVFVSYRSCDKGCLGVLFA